MSDSAPDTQTVTIVEVAPRDGFQAVEPFIPTQTKVAYINALLSTGIRRIEIGAFVSPRAIPQMADIETVLASVQLPAHVAAAALVPNQKGAQRAIANGITHVVFVLSVSESHNKANVNRSVDESFAELERFLDDAPPKLHLRLNLATCFHCPFEGLIAPHQVIACIERASGLCPNIEYGICDTTGRATPDRVDALFKAIAANPATANLTYAFHGHDTYGFGISNALAAYRLGVRIFDGAVAGLGGCPFAPGASGNTATEDLAFTFQVMNVTTDIDTQAALVAADQLADIPGGQTGGHIRMLPRETILAQLSR